MPNHRAHTPIVSRQQQKLFGMWKSNPDTKPASITGEEVTSHLKESKGRKLPKRTKPKKKVKWNDKMR